MMDSMAKSHVALYLTHSDGSTDRQIGSALVEPMGALVIPPVPRELSRRRVLPSLRCAIAWVDDAHQVNAEIIDVDYIAFACEPNRPALVALELS
jgi:hypothetical protein